MSEIYDPQLFIEAALFAADEPLSIDRLRHLLLPDHTLNALEVKNIIQELQTLYEQRGVMLIKVANGYRFQTQPNLATSLQRLWQKKPPRYSRALLETLALIVYRQPITRGEIEQVRGVAVSTHIMKTLQERQWVKVVGQRDVPGKPALFGTTKQFLDYFNLTSLAQLPSLAEMADLDQMEHNLAEQLDLTLDASESQAESGSANVTQESDDPEHDSVELQVELDNADAKVNESESVELVQVESDSADAKVIEPELVELAQVESEDTQSMNAESDDSEHEHIDQACDIHDEQLV